MPFTHVSALIVADDFERAVGTTVGGAWVERSGNFYLTEPANQTVKLGCTDQVNFRICENTAGTTEETFVQVGVRHSGTDQFPSVVLRFDWNGGAVKGINWQIGPTGGGVSCNTANGGGYSSLFIDGNTNPVLHYCQQMYAEDSLQEMWLSTGANPAIPLSNTTLVTNTETNTTHNGTSRTVALQHGWSLLSGQGESLWDDFIWTGGKSITVNGLPTGYTAELLNASLGVVITFTPAVNVVDATRYTNTVAEIVPITGWPKLRVKDGIGTIIEEYTAAGIYPGDVLTWTPPLLGYPFLGTMVIGVGGELSHVWHS